MTFRGNFNKYSKAISYPRFNRDRFKIVMAGSLDAVRGLRLLVKLLESTQSYQIINNCDFVISGPSKSQFRQELSDAISTYRSRGGSAEFRGLLDREELESEYKSADIFLSLQDPSHAFSKASFPSKIMEYAGYRRPIVSTAVSDLMNVDLFEGIVFCEYNHRALEAAILSVMDGYRGFVIDAEKISTRLEASSSLNANKINFSRLIKRIEAL
jgi:glycosyltransferase involved in cell wall biosynthesis